MNIIFIFILAAIVFAVIYILSSKEEKKISEKFAPRGKVEEYCLGEKDRRKCQRFNTELDLKYSLISSPRSSFSTNSRNISAVGISILVYELLPKDSFIEMEVSVPGSKENLKLKGKIAWCEGCEKGIERFDKEGKRIFVVGIEFADADKQQQETLAKYISRHLSNSEK